jgi:DNA-binding MarR family transcriptional regulator
VSVAAAAPPELLDPAEAGLGVRYRDNLARHLIGVARDVQARLTAHLNEQGYRDLRPSLAPLLSLLWLEPRPLRALAQQLAVTKQACSQLVTAGEAAGYVERSPHPDDGRAKQVQLSPAGRRLVTLAIEQILEIDTEYAARIGPGRYADFTAALAALFEGLCIPTHADEALRAGARRSAGVLPLMSVRVQHDLMEATAAQGHVGLKLSHGQVLPLIGPAGARVHQLARLHGVTRQAISATCQDLESMGVLARQPDPVDRRGVVLQLTEAGTRLIRDSVRALDVLEARLVAILGRRSFERLSRAAHDLYRALHLEEEIFGDAGVAEGQGIEGLALSLHQRLGDRDAARLAALLEMEVRRNTT